MPAPGPHSCASGTACLVTEPHDPPQLLGTAALPAPHPGESHMPVCETGMHAGSHRGRGREGPEEQRFLTLDGLHAGPAPESKLKA